MKEGNNCKGINPKDLDLLTHWHVKFIKVNTIQAVSTKLVSE